MSYIIYDILLMSIEKPSMGLEAVDFIMKETEIRVVFIDQLKRLRSAFKFLLSDAPF